MSDRGGDDIQPVDEIPPPLLEAVARRAGQVVLIVGAGCSKEPPTGLPLADELAERCHDALVADGVIYPCRNKSDLSEVADAVFDATNGQAELVRRFPPDRFRNASANAGHTLAAALLREGVISCLLVLNFDLALSTALANVSAGVGVTTVTGPGDHEHLGNSSLVYLHRSISEPPDELILRSEELKAWEGAWEEAMARRVLVGPETVFVGLGTPAAVLVETTKRIIGAIAEGTNTYVVDPLNPEASEFVQALGFTPTAYIKRTWGQFMQLLGERALVAQNGDLEREAMALIAENGWEVEDCERTCQRLGQLGLVQVGRLRASWLMSQESYSVFPTSVEMLRLVADLVVTVAMVERLSGGQVEFREDGTLDIRLENKTVVLMICSAGGTIRAGALGPRVSERRTLIQAEGREPSGAVVTSLPGGRPETSTPSDIASEESPESLTTGAEELPIVTADELRAGVPGIQAVLD